MKLLNIKRKVILNTCIGIFAIALVYVFACLYTYHRKHSTLQQAQSAIRENQNDASCHVFLGDAYWDCGRFEESIEAYNQAVKVNPDYGYGYICLGYSYKDLGHQEKAIESIRRAIKCEPEIPGLNNILGDMLVEFGNHEEATKAYQATLIHDPTNKIAKTRLDFLMSQGT